MHKAFQAREKARQHAASTKWVIGKGQLGFSWSKKCPEEQRALAEMSETTEFEWVMQANADADIYDSDADDEAETLECAIEWEKHSQVKWRAERRRATEAHNKRLIVSRWERMEKYLALANQLTYSEQQNWLDVLKKLDLAQGS